MTSFVTEARALLGSHGWRETADAGGQIRDWLDRYGVPPLGIARPASTAEVAATVSLARAHGVAIVPQGGNTGLVGGGVATRPDSVLVSLDRMTAIEPISPGADTVAVEAGVILADLHAALAGTGRMFPLHLGAEGSARIGGLIACNAGGSHAFRYGTMQDLVLGLEVVLPDGTIWNGLRRVLKDNAGYQLRRLFCGSEGTLGIVTRAILRLKPEPRRRETALVALPDPAALVGFGHHLHDIADEFLMALEFFSDTGLDLALKHVPGLTFPLATRAPMYLLIELATTAPQVALDGILQHALEAGLADELLLDGVVASSEAQRRALWRLREEQPEGQRREGAQLKHDIAVPVSEIADFIAKAGARCAALTPGVRINPFGHLADGNIHYNLTPPEGVQDFAGQADAIGDAVYRLAEAMGGSFAAEHGLGRAKVALADALRSPEERRAMRALKAALDPAGLMNPGVII